MQERKKSARRVSHSVDRARIVIAGAARLSTEAPGAPRGLWIALNPRIVF
jgi:hypothetical protein